ncbi:MraY family glycosyltransferase [Pedobacter rhodius]|uniref:Glycosyltransferase family 4 protein n=1 Tax=Pedobacter rhodius TaxID=3004098 RepID=A0ABT4KZJ2_9SPHI|nr:glycosyltransferase family 4 protein [Pedobacter sp. SJ11]MCZ4224358.1 glycosyltransferase family 4 protein [Pedobacter sp. SJ11]
MNFTISLILLVVLFFLMLLYIKTAEKFKIIDKPNRRSSHTDHIVRGGGIIFPIAILTQFPIFGFQNFWFVAGLVLISLISFIDDVKPVANRIRLFFHLAAVALLFYQLQVFELQWYFIFLAFFFVIGTINAVNFMDGINGITGGYGLITLISLLYINQTVEFTDSNLILCAIMAVLVFNFFNFRKKAKCFAGDVGSISLAFILVFFLLQLIISTQNITYIMLLLVYGLDVVSTIMFRLIRKENIFEAHRKHFYQFLVNEKKMPHLAVAILYSMVQLGINFCLIRFPFSSLAYLLIILSILGMFIVILRFVFEGYRRLTKNAGID